MSYTSHGHHVPGTGWENAPKTGGDPCGGPRVCGDCGKEVELFVGTPTDWPAAAKKLLMEHLLKQYPSDDELEFTVYIVWASKILKNWKGLLATTLPDGMYYELTWNGEKNEWYLDEYQKYRNTVYPAL